MKRTFLLLLFVKLSLISFTSCVDKNYDLSDINTDDLVVGETFIAPLGKGVVSAEDIVDLSRTPAVTTESNGNYVARYTGELSKISLNSIQLRSGSLVEVASAEVNTGDLDNLFDGDFVLSMVDPHILLDADVKQGSAQMRLDLETSRGNLHENTSSEFVLSSVQPKVWIGGVQSSVIQGYHFVENKDMTKLIQIIPSYISLRLLIDPTSLAEIDPDALNGIKYTVEVPFQPTSDFKAESIERVEDAFDDSFVDYVFSDGSATIYGDITNDMPFDFTMEMVILNEGNQSVGISFPVQNVKGSEPSQISFEISEQDMPKMKEARHIQLKFSMYGRENAGYLNQNQKIVLNLKLKKTGGISI